MWTVAEWEAWAKWARDGWTSSLASAWQAAQDSVRSAVEATAPAVLQRRAQEAWDALWGPDGAYALVKGYSEAMSAADEPARADMQARAAAAAGISVADAAPDAFTARLDALGSGILRDARWQSDDKPVIGIVPIIVGGVILGIGGLCWLWVHKEAVDVERSRLELISRFGTSDPDGALVALRQAAPASSTPLLLGGLVVAGLVVGASLWGRR